MGFGYISNNSKLFQSVLLYFAVIWYLLHFSDDTNTLKIVTFYWTRLIGLSCHSSICFPWNIIVQGFLIWIVCVRSVIRILVCGAPEAKQKLFSCQPTVEPLYQFGQTITMIIASLFKHIANGSFRYFSMVKSLTRSVHGTKWDFQKRKGNYMGKLIGLWHNFHHPSYLLKPWTKINAKRLTELCCPQVVPVHDTMWKLYPCKKIEER